MANRPRYHPQDSRSPTIGQTPSRNIPVRSTEAPLLNSSLPHLLDGLRHQIDKDREEQDKLLKAVRKIQANVKEIRKRQDECWAEIQNVLRAAAGPEQDDDEDENEALQDSQTQFWDYEGADGDKDRDPSEARDSVLGVLSQLQDEDEDIELGQPNGAARPSASVVAAVEIARIPDHGSRVRASTERHALHMLDVMDGMDIEEDADAGPSPQSNTSPRGAPASAVPTSTSPSGTRNKGPIARSSMAKGRATEVAAQTRDRSSSSELPDVETLLARPSKSPNTPMRPPPRPTAQTPRTPKTPKTPKTPATGSGSGSTSKGKRKRTTNQEKDFIPSISAGPRAKRLAASSAEKKNKALYEWISLSAREQSQAVHDEVRSPFWNCGGCRRKECLTCRE